MTYSEAVEIMRYAQKCGVEHVTLTLAMELAQFSFPMEKKLEVIKSVVMAVKASDGRIWSLHYFREPFRAVESDYHKGVPPKSGEMMRVSDILGIKE